MQDAGENQKPETDKYYIRPKAANDRMKLAQNMGQTVYISGATGFGKTSFVADYLFRRRYEYYSMAESVPEDILPKRCTHTPKKNAAEKQRRPGKADPGRRCAVTLYYVQMDAAEHIQSFF